MTREIITTSMQGMAREITQRRGLLKFVTQEEQQKLLSQITLLKKNIAAMKPYLSRFKTVIFLPPLLNLTL